ncbi:hypothetical protein BOW50_08460 [Solemya velum gill symbiont]|uniref:sulfur globule family protein n=1 Tax=Solemya velum gill symbiont TaxID=2340 RepID=UPI00099698BB|nr:sulfur globule family protein [Solemya velum gill symbiont]OOZ77092.1 hypothetical protein BOW50_08460 [Solemya velum gill symbiont]
MKKIITAAAIAAIMGASSAAVAEWDMPFFGDDNDSSYYNDNRWNNDGYGNFNMDADADTEFDGETDNSYYGRGYNNMDNRWDNRYNSYNGRYGAPYGYGPAPYGPAPFAPAAPQAPAATGNCPQ